MTLKPPPSEIDRLRVDAHEQVYAPEPLSERRECGAERRAADHLVEGGLGFWVGFGVAAVAVAFAAFLRLLS